MKAKTKEEKFLMAVYETALAAGDPFAEVDRYTTGQQIGLHPRGINTICNQLAQANFIRKRGETLITITNNGLELFQDLKKH